MHCDVKARTGATSIPKARGLSAGSKSAVTCGSAFKAVNRNFITAMALRCGTNGA